MKIALVLIGAILGTVLMVGVVYRLWLGAQGFTITSWWRTPEHNRNVGGVPNSLHLIGWAWDVVPVTRENELRLASMGLTTINEGDHIHAMVKIG